MNTVEFSNHTGYGSWRGPVLAASDVADVLAGVAERDVFGTCDAVLSGYQGSADVGAVVLAAVAAVKAANPAAWYCADPVLGDRWCGFYVAPGIPEFMRDHVVPAADITTPNHFELEYLAGRPVTDLAGLLEALAAVRSSGPRIVLATSIELADDDPSRISMVAASDDGSWLVSTPRLELAAVSGSGDLTAALFLAHLLEVDDVARALGRTASSVFGVLEATAEARRHRDGPRGGSGRDRRPDRPIRRHPVALMAGLRPRPTDRAAHRASSAESRTRAGTSPPAPVAERAGRCGRPGCPSGRRAAAAARSASVGGVRARRADRRAGGRRQSRCERCRFRGRGARRPEQRARAAARPIARNPFRVGTVRVTAGPVRERPVSRATGRRERCDRRTPASPSRSPPTATSSSVRTLESR